MTDTEKEIPLVTTLMLEARGLAYLSRENDLRAGAAMIGAGDCLMAIDDATGRVGWVMQWDNNIVPCPVPSNVPDALCTRVWEEQPSGGYGDTITERLFDEVRDGLGIWWAANLPPEKLRLMPGWDQVAAIEAGWKSQREQNADPSPTIVAPPAAAVPDVFVGGPRNEASASLDLSHHTEKAPTLVPRPPLKVGDRVTPDDLDASDAQPVKATRYAVTAEGRHIQQVQLEGDRSEWYVAARMLLILPDVEG